jgi:hypothetical protein
MTNKNTMSDSMSFSSGLTEEFEALDAILSPEDEFQWKFNDKNNVIVSVKIAPLTASDTTQQYVGLVLQVLVDQYTYPDNSGPVQVDLHTVRGLDEDSVTQLRAKLKERCEEFIGKKTTMKFLSNLLLTRLKSLSVIKPRVNSVFSDLTNQQQHYNSDFCKVA